MVFLMEINLVFCARPFAPFCALDIEMSARRGGAAAAADEHAP
jgi:hypothetical protein